MKDSAKRFDDFQRDDANRVKIEGLRIAKTQRNKEEAGKETLANAKIQGELIKHMRAEREAFDKDWAHKARVVEAEGLKQLKERKHKEYLQKDVLANDKIQGQLIKHMREERKRFDDFQRDDANRVKIEGLRIAKTQRNKEEAGKDVLANNKLQFEVSILVFTCVNLRRVGGGDCVI